ncbi:MAG TPA: type II CAAX endopeptidase family protein [Terriglobales bacterium]|nr:type II CAAX endopeptidase family protein [Terriglobales bacterium]
MDHEPIPPSSTPTITLAQRANFAFLFLLCLVGFVVTQILSVNIAARLVHAGGDSLAFNSVYRPLALSMMLFLFGVIARYLGRNQGSLLEVQGLGMALQSGRELVKGLSLGTVMILLCVIAIALFGRYSAQMLPSSGIWLRILGILWMGITAATMEEVAFRGYPFQALTRSIGPWGATLALALLFGFIHLSNPNSSALGFLNTALVSVLLSIAYLRTGYLWMPIGIHVAWNLVLGTVFGLPVSGVNIFAVIVKGMAEGPILVTGGDYGIEASVVCAIVILAGIVAVYWMAQPKIVSSNGTSSQV